MILNSYTNGLCFLYLRLYTRDPHQLFELLCIQIRSIVLAYNLGLKDILKKDENGVHIYNPTELLNCKFCCFM